MNSDSKVYGGYDRIAEGQEFSAVTEKTDKDERTGFKIYLPSRTCMILAKK